MVSGAELVSDFSNNQEKIPDSKNVLHGESNYLYMHDDKSKDENISSLNTNTLEIDLNENRETAEKELDTSVVSLPIEKDCSVSLNISSISKLVHAGCDLTLTCEFMQEIFC
jgi:hypothetical protein